jgi:phosphoglycolate phosphatase-like HAD superfamily hydrolase
MLMKPAQYILSDADGTLVDTVTLIRHGQFEAAMSYLTRHGLAVEHIPSYERYEKALNVAVGGRTRETFERTIRLLFSDTPEHIDAFDYDELNALLNPIQDRLAPSYITAFPGLANLLSWIGESDRSLAIFTSGSPHHIVRNIGIALPELGMSELYTQTDRTDEAKLAEFIEVMKSRYKIGALCVVTCDDVVKTKPDPEGLKLALKRLGGTAAESLVLGDLSVDMITGQRAGIPIRIGITHGFDDRSVLQNNGATNVIDSLEEVIKIVER